MMDKTFIAKAMVTINAPAAKVWEALTTPEILKQYYFGADIISDWKVGSPIVYKGRWQGKSYEDKGSILAFEPPKLLVATHWSPLSGVPDSPENYHKVRYELSEREGKTTVTLTQDNNASEEEKTQNDQFWKMLLDALKKLLES
jgi:uncharacterized protein YndB with AHSA1/START domain